MAEIETAQGSKNIRQNWKRKILPCIKKFLSIFAQLSGIVSIISLIFFFKINYFSEAEIKCNFAKYRVGKVEVYQGELINISSIHAKEVAVKGKFNSEVIRLDVDASDIVEPSKKHNNLGSVEFSLERLSRKNKCLFSIIVPQHSEIIEQFYISWGKNGSLPLKLQQADPKIQKAFDLGGNLSHSARQKWFENNAKNIR